MMKKVYVGMSGGVDSSVSAALLKEQGYAVTGVYMKNWTQDVAGVACPWADDLRDARAVAAQLDIPFKVFDFQHQYREKVVETMVSEYAAGRTPNPDVLCNQDIKFSLFLAAALADGADMIATGHYAQTESGKLLKAVDYDKDQTYFLYRVTSEALKQTLFPIGHLTKPEVRREATRLGLATATKPDSQGICFVGEVGVKAFLSEQVKAVPGPVIHNGLIIGEHDGAIFYTIGQRHGLGIGGGKPYYVTAKDMDRNAVYVSDDPNDLIVKPGNITLDHLHWIHGPHNDNNEVSVRLRHRGKLIPAQLKIHNEHATVQLQAEERSLAAGQSLVIYRNNEIIGGGIILDNSKHKYYNN